MDTPAVGNPIVLLIWAIVILALVIVAIEVIKRTLPADFQLVGKLLVGLVGLLALLYLLFPAFS